MSIKGLCLDKIDPERAQLALRHRMKWDPENTKLLEPGQKFSDHDKDISYDLPKELQYILNKIKLSGITKDNINDEIIKELRNELDQLKTKGIMRLMKFNNGDFDLSEQEYLEYYNKNPYLI